ncbi:hypothetical protein B0H16DRAFT_1745778 [Mycena metata]|uniref:Uncharacterized protein n=1 Tax=Mycena metata TaxID=1033252 RepID=A0AAD7MBZ6_9AGAR|nr:hypothetical protein B0H16DRAFT_1745778 [Mycena metata]
MLLSLETSNPPRGVKFTSTFPGSSRLHPRPCAPHTLIDGPRCPYASVTAVSAHRALHRLHPTPCASIRLIDGAHRLCASATAISIPPAPDRLHPRPCPSIRLIDGILSSHNLARTHPLKYLGPRWLCASATVVSAPPASDCLHPRPCASIHHYDSIPPSPFTLSTAPYHHTTSPSHASSRFRPPLPCHARHGRFCTPPPPPPPRPRASIYLTDDSPSSYSPLGFPAHATSVHAPALFTRLAIPLALAPPRDFFTTV